MASKVARWNGIQWVIVTDIDDTNSKLVLPPAEANARSDVANVARFGHGSASDEVGHMVAANGQAYAIEPTGLTFDVYNRKAGGHDLLMRAALSGLDVSVARMGARTAQPSWARFGRGGDATGNQGFICHDTGGLEASAASGQFFHVHDGVTHIAEIAATKSWINGWTLAPAHPTHTGHSAIYRESHPGGGDYVILSNVAQTFLNGRDNLYLRRGNAENGIIIDGTYVNTHTRIYAHAGIHSATDAYITGTANVGGLHSRGVIVGDFAGGNGAWNWANIISQTTDTWNGARVAIHANGVGVSQWRVAVHQGSGMIEAVNHDNSVYSYVGAAGFASLSALRYKTDIRPLRPDLNQRSAMRASEDRDPLADTVDLPDIMALRPVAYRPIKPYETITKIDPDGPDDDEDNWLAKPYPPNSVHGRESRRERLGLVAEDVEHVIPSAVLHSDVGETYGIDFAQITVALVDHVQQLTEQVTALQAAIEGNQP